MASVERSASKGVYNPLKNMNNSANSSTRRVFIRRSSSERSKWKKRPSVKLNSVIRPKVSLPLKIKHRKSSTNSKPPVLRRGRVSARNLSIKRLNIKPTSFRHQTPFPGHKSIGSGSFKNLGSKRRRSKWLKRSRPRRASSMDARMTKLASIYGYEDNVNHSCTRADLGMRSKSFQYDIKMAREKLGGSGSSLEDMKLEEHRSCGQRSFDTIESIDGLDPLHRLTLTQEEPHVEDELCCPMKKSFDIDNCLNSCGRLIRSDTGSRVYFAESFFKVALRKGCNGLGFDIIEMKTKSEQEQEQEPEQESQFCDGNSSILIINKVFTGKDAPRGDYGELPLGILSSGDQLVMINGKNVCTKEQVDTELSSIQHDQSVVIGIVAVHESYELELDQQSDCSYDGFESARTRNSIGTLSNFSRSSSSSSDQQIHLQRSVSDAAHYFSNWIDKDEDDDDGDHSNTNEESESESKSKHILSSTSEIVSTNTEKVKIILSGCLEELIRKHGEITYDMVRLDAGRKVDFVTDSNEWRVWFRDQLDSLCNDGLYIVAGIDMETMSPVLIENH